MRIGAFVLHAERSRPSLEAAGGANLKRSARLPNDDSNALKLDATQDAQLPRPVPVGRVASSRLALTLVRIMDGRKHARR